MHTRTKILCHICVDRPILSRLICDSGGVHWRHRSQNISWFTYKCLCKVVFLHSQLVDKYYKAPFSFNFQPCPMSPPQDVMPMLLGFLLACCQCLILQTLTIGRLNRWALCLCFFNLLFYLQNSIFHSPKLTLSCHDMMQCIVYNTPVPVALECLGSTLSRQGMYKRIARWRSSLAPANLAIVQLIEVARGIMPRCSAPLLNRHHRYRRRQRQHRLESTLKEWQSQRPRQKRWQMPLHGWTQTKH